MYLILTIKELKMNLLNELNNFELTGDISPVPFECDETAEYFVGSALFNDNIIDSVADDNRMTKLTTCVNEFNRSIMENVNPKRSS